MMISTSIIRFTLPPSHSPLLIKTFHPSLKMKCRSSSSKNSEENNDLKNALSGMMGEQVEQLLSREENKVLFDNLQKASQRVEIAKTQLAFIQKQELALKHFKDYTQQLQGNAFQVKVTFLL
jgi:hypothetical protein